MLQNKICNLRLYGVIITFSLLLIFYKEFKDYDGIPSIGLMLILLMEIILVLFRTKWWNSKKYILILSIIIAMVLTVNYCYGIQTSTLLWPLVWFLGILEKKYNWLSIILTSSIIVIILFMSYPSGSILQTLFALSGIFLGIRSSRIRQETFITSQLHLQELKQVHKELERSHEKLLEASVYSMRYAALEERTRLAREIHDCIGHQLTSLIVQLQALEIMLPDNPEKGAELVSQLLQISRRAMLEVRIAVKEWSDDEMGLGLIAIKGLISQIQSQSIIQYTFIEDSEITEWSIDKYRTL